MLVQALAAFARNVLQQQLNDVAFEERTVPYFLDIGSDGRFNNIVERFAAIAPRPGAKTKTKANGKQRPLTYAVPRSPVTLTSGVYALLGTGELKYVLGAGPWTEEKNVDRDNERLKKFIELLTLAYNETKDQALEASLHFYGSPSELIRAREALQAAVPGSYVALSCAGQVLTDREQIQEWWRARYASESTGRAGLEGECLITGKTAPIPPTHPQIRHTTNIGGKAGVAMMSFNAAAFRSYGWEQNANSPVSADAALQYTMALNHLLKPGSPNRKDIGGVAFVFWLKNESSVQLDPSKMVDEAPNPNRISEVQMILSADHGAWLRENVFYMVALSANGSRLIVRSSLTEKLPKVAANVIDWWKGLQIQPLDSNKPLSVPKFWQLANALDRKGEISDDRTALLWNRALGGVERPLGFRIVADVLSRIRADKNKRLDQAALGLLRLCLNDIHHVKGEGESVPVALDEESPNRYPAYVLGRLLALYDRIQFKTFDFTKEAQPNATVADRFYTLMMNTPSAGFALVANLGQKHLTKLRRAEMRLHKPEDDAKSIARSFGWQISQLTELLAGQLPTRFGLHDKARFALGYYHQKAYRPKKVISPDNKPADAGDMDGMLPDDGREEKSFLEELES